MLEGLIAPIRIMTFVAICFVGAMVNQPALAQLTGEGHFGRALCPSDVYAAAAPLSAMYFTTPRTVECWARIRNKQEDTPLLAYEPKSSIEHWEIFAAKGSGALSPSMTGYKPLVITSTSDIADGQWHYLAMTFDGSTVHLFVDAKSVAEQAVRKLAGWSDVGALTFGHADKMATPTDLLLDEVRISRGLRTFDRVPDGPFTPDADTVGLWHFDEDGTAGFADSSPNHNKAKKTTGDEDFVSVNPVSSRWGDEDHGPFFSSSLSSSKPSANETNKGISIRLGADRKAAICFDTELLRVSAAWTGGFMKIYPGRDGLSQHPDPGGHVEFGCAAAPGWSTDGKFSDPRPDHVGPLPPERGHYTGLYLNGQQVVLSYTIAGTPIFESYDLETHDGEHAFARTIEVGPSRQPLTVVICEQPHSQGRMESNGAQAVLENPAGVLSASLIGTGLPTQLEIADGSRVLLTFAPHETTVRAKVVVWRGDSATMAKFKELATASAPASDLIALTHGGPARWITPVVTQGTLGNEAGPYVVDTLSAPDDNPWKSYLRFSGLDFFSNGDAAICSISGDVWIVSGIDDKLNKLTWRRFATGLFQPLGLKIVDDIVYVIGRDQITRLHDLNNDGEADFYENFNNGCKVTPGAHEFCTCLETDPQGNFYYTKCGNPTEHGGSMLKVSKDGSKIEVYASGLRNPNGMAISPEGIISTSDNEGEWVPASRIDFVKSGQFLGFVPTAHGPTPNHPGYPIWIPHSIDNSSGGQVWVTSDKWGPLKGAFLHTSYGASSLYLVMPEIVNQRLQGGTYKFPLKFASGIMRARFNPKDGQLYVCGLKGWQTNGVRDGAFQRVRYTGKPLAIPREIHAHKNGVEISFTAPLDPKLAEDVESWGVSRWNYRWTSQYGSHDWSVANPQQQGHDTVEVKSARISKDHRTVFLEIPSIAPVMQMEIQYNVATEDGTPIEQEIYQTIHEFAP